MRWARKHFAPMLGLVLLALVAVTFWQFSMQQRAVAEAVRCQNGLLTVFVSRGSAASDERTALRQLVLGLRDGVSDTDESNFKGFQYAIARADQVYRVEGNLSVAQSECAGSR